MVILDKPYVSDFMQKALSEMNVSVLVNTADDHWIQEKTLNTVSEAEFIKKASRQAPLALYCNSENSIDWIVKNLSHTGIPEKINLFKDKAKFRKILKGLYPDFYFREVESGKLQDIDVTKINKPFILKPAIGFLSMGVYKIHQDNEWPDIVQMMKLEMEKVKDIFPVEVMDSSKFIIEECIEGEEFAIDAYFNDSGEPVILNIFEHYFSSANDVSDRLYGTSKKIMEQYLDSFQQTLAGIGALSNLKNFPVHLEVRVNKNGRVVPIEVNPMRFAGWCTADIAYYAYGINVYDYYFKQIKPDWKSILQDKDDKLYCIVVAEIPKNIEQTNIKEVNYNKMAEEFGELFEIRKIDYRSYPVLAFLFIGIPNDPVEISNILQKDMREYIQETS